MALTIGIILTLLCFLFVLSLGKSSSNREKHERKLIRDAMRKKGKK